MEIRERGITREEMEYIYMDLWRIEQAAGAQRREERRIELTAEDGGRLAGYASGITEGSWFYITDLWVEEGFCPGKSILRKLISRSKNLEARNMYNILYITIDLPKAHLDLASTTKRSVL